MVQFLAILGLIIALCFGFSSCSQNAELKDNIKDVSLELAVSHEKIRDLEVTNRDLYQQNLEIIEQNKNLEQNINELGFENQILREKLESYGYEAIREEGILQSRIKNIEYASKYSLPCSNQKDDLLSAVKSIQKESERKIFQGEVFSAEVLKTFFITRLHNINVILGIVEKYDNDCSKIIIKDICSMIYAAKKQLIGDDLYNDYHSYQLRLKCEKY